MCNRIPYRDLVTYPWIETKIEALMRSIKEVGFWEGVIARKNGDKFQVAFGHHRLEAARRLKLTTVPLVIRGISDKEMLQFMGRENGEDYHTDFLVMLATWESAIRYEVENLPPDRRQKIENVTINMAKLLGWIDSRSQSNKLALTCAKAIDLMANELVTRDDLKGLSCDQAKNFLSGLKLEINRTKHRFKNEPETGKKQIAKVSRVAKETAEKIRSGEIRPKDIKTSLDTQGLRLDHDDIRQFSSFVQDTI